MTSRLFGWMSFGFRTFLLGQKLPYLFGIEISDRCNLDCFYCEGKNKGRYYFSYGQACQALNDAYNRGHRALYFTGGEPMIWQDGDRQLNDLVSYARETGFKDVFIYTNGTRPLDIRGCRYIVTIDGPREVHNRIRNDTYDMILKNARAAVTSAVFASITITKANVDWLELYAKEITDTGLFRGISFNLLTHWPEIVAQYGFSGIERERVIDRVWELKQQGYPFLLSAAAYKALRNNNWKRPLPQIELGLSPDEMYTCCRDIGNKEICNLCGYVGCVEVSQVLAMKPSAIWQAIQMAGIRD
ncbi:MAG: radical SAM protein [Candidatus Sedimenticola sp. 20ELBAFRAG]